MLTFVIHCNERRVGTRDGGKDIVALLAAAGQSQQHVIDTQVRGRDWQKSCPHTLKRPKLSCMNCPNFDMPKSLQAFDRICSIDINYT